MSDMLHILEAQACGPSVLEILFDNGIKKRVDVSPLLRGPVFRPLLDPDYFSQVEVDPICRTVVWPNGADFAPEALLDLPALQSKRRA